MHGVARLFYCYAQSFAIGPIVPKQLMTKVLLFLQSGLKKFLDYVYKSDADKITELTNKGLDPNFLDNDKGGQWHFICFTFFYLI